MPVHPAPVPRRPAASITAPRPSPAPAHDRTFAPGTLLETPSGWRPVETIRQGDRVRTVDDGLAKVCSVVRQPPDRNRVHWHVPAGTLGNCSDLRLTAGQHLALQVSECEALFDAACVLVPVPAATGFCGIRTVSGFTLRHGIALYCEDEAIVYAQTGTLLHVPAQDRRAGYRVLNYREARMLLYELCQRRQAERPSAGARSGVARPVG